MPQSKVSKRFGLLVCCQPLQAKEARNTIDLTEKAARFCQVENEELERTGIQILPDLGNSEQKASRFAGTYWDHQKGKAMTSPIRLETTIELIKVTLVHAIHSDLFVRHNIENVALHQIYFLWKSFLSISWHKCLNLLYSIRTNLSCNVFSYLRVISLAFYRHSRRFITFDGTQLITENLLKKNRVPCNSEMYHTDKNRKGPIIFVFFRLRLETCSRFILICLWNNFHLIEYPSAYQRPSNNFNGLLFSVG